MKLKESKTYLNLAKSFAGECQAMVRYRFMEYGLRKEGYKCLAEMVDNVAYNEFQHARMFYTKLQGADNMQIDNIDISSGYPFRQKWDLKENLRLAAIDEGDESDRIYAEYERTAREEGFEDIAELYKNVRQVENCHRMLFEDLFEQMNTGTLYSKPTKQKWKCSACGYEEEGKDAFSVCPLCGEMQGAVMLKVES